MAVEAIARFMFWFAIGVIVGYVLRKLYEYLTRR